MNSPGAKRTTGTAKPSAAAPSPLSSEEQANAWWDDELRPKTKPTETRAAEPATVEATSELDGDRALTGEARDALKRAEGGRVNAPGQRIGTLLLERFAGRTDCYLVQEKGGAEYTSKDPLTETLVMGHLNGGRRIGIYPTQYPSALGFDIDGKNLPGGLMEARSVAQALDRALVREGLPPLVLELTRSGISHRGTVFFDPEDRPSLGDMLVFGRAIVRAAGLVDDEDDTVGHVRCFPRPAGGNAYGNTVYLPLHGVLNGGVGRFVDIATGEPLDRQEGPLEEPSLVTAAQVRAVTMKLLADERAAGIAPPPLNGNGKAVMREADIAEVLAGVPDGGREDALFSLACTMYRDGVPLKYAETFIVQAANAAIPPYDAAKCLDKVRRRYERGTGGRVDEPVIVETADQGMPAADVIPEIEVRDELAALTDESVAALEARDGAGLFVRGGALVRMNRHEGKGDGEMDDETGLHRTDGSLYISTAPVAHVREQLDRSARWWKRKHDRATRKQVKVCALPPLWVAQTIMARGEWPFPALEGVTTTPLFRPDGTVLDEPGYDPRTGFYYAPIGDVASIPAHPTSHDAGRAALALTEVYADFPFLGAGDRAAALTLPLAIIGRPAIRGPVPMTAFRAPTPGTGKSLCADVGFQIALGHEAPRSSPSRNDDEMRKHLLAIGLAGDSAVLFDDVSGLFGSEALDAALTGQEVEGRLLGETKIIRVPMRTVFAMTGNNTGFRGALGRRVVPCDLDARLEHPEDRTGWAHADLLGWVKAERARLVAACLTLLRAYHVAGRPAHPHPPKGSFEAWDALIRGALIWAGVGDPLGGQDRIREDSDTDLDGLRVGLHAWHMAFGTTPQTAADVIGKTASDRALLAAVATMTGCDAVKLDARKLGYGLRRYKGRPCDGMMFVRDGEDRIAGIQWSVLVLR